MGYLVHLLKAPSTRGSPGTRRVGYQLAFAMELVVGLSDSSGSWAVASRVMRGLCPRTLLTKPRYVFDAQRRG